MKPLLAPLGLGLVLAACALPPAPETARLPPDAVQGAGDPLRSAVINTSTAFAGPRNLAGRPAEAAIAVAEMEWLALELPYSPRFVALSPTVAAQFAAARREWRASLGIAPDAPAQRVIDGLFAASRALRSGASDAAQAALPAAVFTGGGQATLARLAALPDLPQTNVAAVQATEVLRQQPGAGPRHL